VFFQASGHLSQRCFPLTGYVGDGNGRPFYGRAVFRSALSGKLRGPDFTQRRLPSVDPPLFSMGSGLASTMLLMGHFFLDWTGFSVSLPLCRAASKQFPPFDYSAGRAVTFFLTGLALPPRDLFHNKSRCPEIRRALGSWGQSGLFLPVVPLRGEAPQ